MRPAAANTPRGNCRHEPEYPRGFRRLKNAFAVVAEVQFFGSQQVEHNDFLAMIMDRRNSLKTASPGSNKSEITTVSPRRSKVSRNSKNPARECASLWLRAGQQSEEIVEMPPAAVRGQPLNGFGAELRQTGRVVLPDHQIRQRRGQRAAIMEFIGLAEIHRGARVQQDVTREVGFALEFLTWSLSVRPHTFQSTCRRSSPCIYCR